jgi:hypothetical protein
MPPEISRQQEQAGCLRDPKPYPECKPFPDERQQQTPTTVEFSLMVEEILQGSVVQCHGDLWLDRRVVSRGMLSPTVRNCASTRKHFPSLKYSTQACPSPYRPHEPPTNRRAAHFGKPHFWTLRQRPIQLGFAQAIQIPACCISYSALLSKQRRHRRAISFSPTVQTPCPANREPSVLLDSERA